MKNFNFEFWKDAEFRKNRKNRKLKAPLAIAKQRVSATPELEARCDKNSWGFDWRCLCLAFGVHFIPGDGANEQRPDKTAVVCGQAQRVFYDPSPVPCSRELSDALQMANGVIFLWLLVIFKAMAATNRYLAKYISYHMHAHRSWFNARMLVHIP